MNKIEARNGKLFLMPDNTEISKNSVLGIKYLIREGERLLKQAQKEVEASEKMCDFLRQKAIQGTITANESLAVQDRILAESILNRNSIEKEIEDLKFSLEIAEEKAKSVGIKKDKPQLSDRDILTNFKACFSGLLINVEGHFKRGNDEKLLEELEYWKLKDVNENLSNKTLQILQSENRNGNKEYLRVFRGELEEIKLRIEKIEQEYKDSPFINQLTISLQGFSSVWGFLVEAFEIYFVKNGKRQMSDWDFLKQTGTLERFEKAGFSLNPTHDFEQLKPVRLSKYETAKQGFIEERKINRITTTDFELNLFYIAWLKGELKVIEGWLLGSEINGKRRLPSTSDQIEILKYKQFVNTELSNAEGLVNSVENSQPKVEQSTHSKTAQVITNLFEQIDKRGWEYAFTSENEYTSFVGLLTDFFEYKEYTLPVSVFKLKARTKTKIAKILGEVHRELSNSDTLISDLEYFNLIRVLNHFQNDKNHDLYKALTR
jgi:hypothetical protein